MTTEDEGKGRADSAPEADDATFVSGDGDHGSATYQTPDVDVGPAGGASGSRPPDPRRYIMEEEIARGGMGRIGAARDEWLGRRVALKELLRRSPKGERRFGREIRLTARLQHPSIVTVYEAGSWPSGEPFYTMKLVEGRTLEQAASERISLEERMELLPHVIDVMEAMAYAHSRRVIHRDLKPENVLVGAFGETVVVDWGLAKEMDGQAETESSDSASAGLTVEGTVVGTPAYMAPEQARGASVDERSDVYALGAILYRLLAGLPPYQGRDAMRVVTKVITGPPVPLEEQIPEIPPDLAAIVAKAMARDPADRYPSALELAAELRRYQTGQLVAAHHYSRRDLVRRFLRRYRAAVAVATISLLLVAILSMFGLRRILKERDAATAARALAEKTLLRAERAKEQAVSRADEITIVQAESRLAQDPVEALRWLLELSKGTRRLPAARILAGDAVERGIYRVAMKLGGKIRDAAFSPDGSSLGAAAQDGTVAVLSIRDGSLRKLPAHQGMAKAIAFSPLGDRLASAGQDGMVRVNQLGGGQAATWKDHEGLVAAIAYSADGTQLASGGWDGTVRVRSGSGVRTIGRFEGKVLDLAFAPGDGAVIAASANGETRSFPVDGGASRLVAAGAEGGGLFAMSRDGSIAAATRGDAILVTDAALQTTRTLRGHEAPIMAIAYSQDGKLIASASQDQSVRIREGSRSRRLEGPTQPVLRLAFSPDGSKLLAGGVGELWLFDRSSGEATRLAGSRDWILDVGFSPKGDRLFAACGDGRLLLYKTPGRAVETVGRHDREAVDVAWSQGGLLASCGFDGSVKTYGEHPHTFGGHKGAVKTIAFSPDGKILASGSQDGTVRLWDPVSGKAIAVSSDHAGGVEHVAFSPDGRQVVSCSLDRTVRIFDLKTRVSRVFRGHNAKVTFALFSPGGKTIASASADKTIRLWDLATGDSRVFSGHQSWIRHLDFSPDGRLLASGSADGTVRLWTISDRSAKVLNGHRGAVNDIVFSPDGTLVASAGADRTVRLWSVTTGKSRILAQSEASIEEIAFSPDGSLLASASDDGTVRLIDVASGIARIVIRHAKGVSSVAFSPDGKAVASASLAGDVRIWHDRIPRDETALRTFIAESTGALGE